MADSSFKEEQARKARALAEKCFLAGNVPGARRWMPSWRRGSRASRRPRRPVDWYAVLGLARPRPTWAGAGTVLADGDIKRQHRRLCLLVRPDKNPSAAADGAFKLIQAAWEALSARHPPADDATTNAAAPARPPSRRPPDPPPQPRQWRPPTKPRGPHQERRGASHADAAARAPQAARRPAASPTPGCCPRCGALTPYGKRSLRCMACHWSRTDRWHVDEDDYFE